MRLLSIISAPCYVALVVLFTSCSTIEREGKLKPPALVDPTITTAAAGEDGWNYHRSGEADLDGDGTIEKLVLAAQVEIARGQPAWSDGHHWQVYVESPEGERTQVYAQRLQLGTLTLRLTDEGNGPQILLLEHLPDSFTVFEIGYHGPGEVRGQVMFKRQLDPRGDLASPRLP